MSGSSSSVRRLGLLLVDDGINRRQTHGHGQYYKGIAHYLFDDDE